MAGAQPRWTLLSDSLRLRCVIAGEFERTSENAKSGEESNGYNVALPGFREEISVTVEKIHDVPAAQAYGGVLINSEGEILLREPCNHFGGYVWTFAKGRVDAGETPEQAALCKVKEETGYDAKITGLVPGVFQGDTTNTVFFTMEPVGEPDEPSWETQSIRWVSHTEAKRLVSLTKFTTGRKRDLAVIEALAEL
jgi:ADP-ribose pyrophosphatase YjhB (NUDIX family)